MIKKLPISLLFLMIFNMPLAAQYSHVEFTYQSLRPFVHFQLNFHSYGYNYDAYERTYLKGYMDGVNDQHYYGYNFADMFLNFDTYRRGYRDGFRDRKLLIRLRGATWFERHRFASNDYYAPVFAVRIWLEGLSLAFLQAPAHRLPDRWEYRAHPRLKEYRKWMARRNQNSRDHYYSSRNIERRFEKRIRGYRQKMNKAKKKRHRAISRDRNRNSRNHYGNNRGFKQRHEIDTNHDQLRRNRSVKKNTDRKRKTVRKNSRKKRTRETVRKRVRDTQKSKRKSRSRSRDQDG